jgi:hypothetical protein
VRVRDREMPGWMDARHPAVPGVSAIPVAEVAGAVVLMLMLMGVRLAAPRQLLRGKGRPREVLPRC